MRLAQWLLSSPFAGWVYQKTQTLLQKDAFHSLTRKALKEITKDQNGSKIWNDVLKKLMRCSI
jgi:hypothetical protein